MEIPSTQNFVRLPVNLNIYNSTNTMDNIIGNSFDNYKNDNLELRKTVNIIGLLIKINLCENNYYEIQLLF